MLGYGPEQRHGRRHRPLLRGNGGHSAASSAGRASGVRDEFGQALLAVVGKPYALGQSGAVTRSAAPDRSGLTFPHLVKWVEMVVRARAERAMRGMPISPTQLLLLLLLWERGEATSADLARMMRITPQAMTTLLRPLREQGYLERRVDSAHARRLLLRVTPKGEQVIGQARKLTPAIEDDLLQGFTEDERRTLKHLLGRIARRFG